MVDFKQVGAAWIKNGKKGDYISVNLKSPDGKGYNLNLFPNEKKTAPNQPDYNVSMSTDTADKMNVVTDERSKNQSRNRASQARQPRGNNYNRQEAPAPKKQQETGSDSEPF